MPRRAPATIPSASPSCSSSLPTSGASAASACSAWVTTWSLLCNANNDSRSGCTPPPRHDLVTRQPAIALRRHPLLLQHQTRLFLSARERDLAIEPLQLPPQPPRLHPVHGLVEEVVRPLARPFRAQRLVGARRAVIQSVHD